MPTDRPKVSEALRQFANFKLPDRFNKASDPYLEATRLSICPTISLLDLKHAAEALPIAERLEKRIEALEKALDLRSSEISNWLEGQAPNIDQEQKHLDEGSVERLYWHYGYLVALQDAIKLMGDADAPAK